MPYKDPQKKRDWFQRHKNDSDFRERRKKNDRAYYRRHNKEIVVRKADGRHKYYRAHKSEAKVYNKAYKLRERYDITVEEFIALVRKQEGKCAICKQPFQKREPYVDHDHKTGKIRGLLCLGCNWLVGMIERKELATLPIDQYLGRL